MRPEFSERMTPKPGVFFMFNFEEEWTVMSKCDYAVGVWAGGNRLKGAKPARPVQILGLLVQILALSFLQVWGRTSLQWKFIRKKGESDLSKFPELPWGRGVYFLWLSWAGGIVASMTHFKRDRGIKERQQGGQRVLLLSFFNYF